MSLSATKCKTTPTPITSPPLPSPPLPLPPPPLRATLCYHSPPHSTSGGFAAKKLDCEEHTTESPTGRHTDATTAVGAPPSQPSSTPPPLRCPRVRAPWASLTQSLYTTSRAALSHTGGYSGRIASSSHNPTQSPHRQTQPAPTDATSSDDS